MRKDLAEEVTKTLLECSAKLDQSVASLQGSVDSEYFNQYRAVIGQVMGTIYIEILRPIFSEYPDLEPESMR